MDYKRPAPNYRSLLANASQSPTLKKEAPPEHQKDPPLVTYDAIRERATSESASQPDSTKPNGATQKKRNRTSSSMISFGNAKRRSVRHIDWFAEAFAKHIIWCLGCQLDVQERIGFHCRRFVKLQQRRFIKDSAGFLNDSIQIRLVSESKYT